jgi:hypothetical protein
VNRHAQDSSWWVSNDLRAITPMDDHARGVILAGIGHVGQVCGDFGVDTALAFAPLLDVCDMARGLLAFDWVNMALTQGEDHHDRIG